MAIRLPRRATRILRYLVLACAVFALCYSRACSPASSFLNSSAASAPTARSLRRRAHAVDFAWGSILHRFQNHPRPAAKRKELPWRRLGTGDGARAGARIGGASEGTTRVLIVTSELAGLHKNGGIGTAFLELAEALAGEDDIEMSILVAHIEDSFPVRKVEALRAEFDQKRIQLRFVETEPQPFWPQAWTPIASMRVWNYLREHDGTYDIIHFPDNTGIGYFSALAKHEGLALQQSRIVVGLHGADVEWAAMLNKRYPADRYAVELGVFEKMTAELADVVVAPSEYMLEYARSRGWELPANAFVIPNIVKAPALASPTSSPSAGVHPVKELVFFGRLEERKGTRLLVSTLESLYSSLETSFDLYSLEMITFLGRDQPDTQTRTDASVLLHEALRSIKEHTNATFEDQFLTTYDRDEALAYLQGPGRLAVLPSLADNSPSTVLECITQGIRFIASDVGGVPELVHPDDQAKVLFKPLVASFSDKLQSTMKQLESTPWSPVRPSPETQTAAQDWIGLHRWLASPPPPTHPGLTRPFPLISVCITHYERAYLLPQLLNSLLGQTYSNFEVILVDDGSKSASSLAGLDSLEVAYFTNTTLLAGRPPWVSLRITNSYLGEARNCAAAHARGEWLLFLDDDDVLKPHALETLVNVAHRTNASALSTWLDEFATDVNPLAPRAEGEELPHRRTYWFLGQELGAGLLLNCFGSGNIFVTREAFDGIGGFSTYREVGAEDWEFYTRLALKGAKQLVVPEELIFVRSDPSRYSMKFSMDPWDAHFHALVPLLNDDRIQDLNLAHALMMLKGAVTKEPTARPFADSREDFQLVQGWSGWHYTFEPAESTPTLAEDRQGIISGDSFVLDRSQPNKPYINDGYQEGFISPKGIRTAAVRTFQSPKPMDVVIDLSYRSYHQCGDGTELKLISIGAPGEEPEVLVKWKTMEESFAEFRHDLSLRHGSTVHLISDPLETDECDRVEVRLQLTPIVLENKSWSALAKKAAIEREEAKKASLTQTSAKDWATVEKDHVEEDDVFNIALIFDRNRFPHAKSVIRSAQHFITSRRLVFHLITPKELHEELQHFFAGTPMTLRLYDHELCSFVTRKVLPFSDPDIHLSAHCKMFLPEIITFAQRILYLDTDTTIVSDLSTCYGAPSSPSALISMAVDMGDVCQRNPTQCWPIGLHWRVPPGLDCGNVPSRPSSVQDSSCAEAGELETLQVNGGVALFELAKMREQGFVDRYVQSIVHHYRLVGKPATWGEQDYINSYFRLFPNDLELLPCGCNYQWFGARREVKCGAQPVTIAHHWSHGIARRTEDPYNVLFHHFAADEINPNIPSVPDLTPSLPGASNSSIIVIEHTLNCPRQEHDCAVTFEGTEYGQPVTILSRVLSETFAADMVDTLEAQTYPNISQAIAFREDVDVPSTSFTRDEVELEGTAAGDYDELCARCGNLAGGAVCTTPPLDLDLRRQYFECACSLPDSTAPVMYELEAFASQGSSWILYLDDDKTFVSPSALSLLMAQVDSPDQLVVFRSNTTTGEQDVHFRKKVIPRSTMDGVGFLFHSSHLGVTQWSETSRCGKWATFSRLASRLRLKWLDLVPTMSHPLQRHLPLNEPDDFKMTVIILETQYRISWTALLLETLQMPELIPLVGGTVVASIDTEQGAYGPDVKVVNPSIGSGLAELATLADTESVLLLSDSVVLDKSALTALLTFHLDSPSRLIGLFTSTDPDDFPLPLPTIPEDFDIFTEPDAVVGLPTYTHLLPRTLLTTKPHLETLSTVLATQQEPLHPICHPLLLSAIATSKSGEAPLRILPPEKSVVDRVHDCRIRNWPEVEYGATAGDWAMPMVLKEEENDDNDVLDDEEDDLDAGEDDDGLPPKKPERSRLVLDTDFPPMPSLDECILRIDSIMGSSDWLQPGTDVGLAGPLGVKVGIEKADGVEEERWQAARRIEKCYKV
ncbi:hypothetical protein JCM21900_006130 [Sporobolomyces salmonicolor]